MRTEYWLMKNNDEEIWTHNIVCRFKKSIWAKLACWIINSFRVSEDDFYYRKVHVGVDLLDY